MLPKYLDISKDPLPPSAEEFTQTSPEERAERHERFENRSLGHVEQRSSAQSHYRDNESPSNETPSTVEESEMEKSEMPRRRIGGKRTVEEDAHVPAKKERIECTDLSLACPLPEASQVDVDPELRLRGKRPAVDNQIDQSNRSCVNELPIVPWSASSREKRNLEVDEEMPHKKQCISERDGQLLALRPPV